MKVVLGSITVVRHGDPSLFRDRSTDRGSYPVADMSLLRDRSTDGISLSAAALPAAEQSSSEPAFQWTDAGIGAGAALAFVAMAAFGAFAVRRLRHQPRSA